MPAGTELTRHEFWPNRSGNVRISFHWAGLWALPAKPSCNGVARKCKRLQWKAPCVVVGGLRGPGRLLVSCSFLETHFTGATWTKPVQVIYPKTNYFRAWITKPSRVC